MSTLAITARFPLGTYLGHVGVGQRSDFPDTSRLLSALTHSAGKGSLAEERDGDLRIAEHVLSVLEWLEQHPPSALGMPYAVPVRASGSPTHAWRDEGVHDKAAKDAPQRRKVEKSQSDAVAVDGAWGWGWEEDVPDHVVETVRLLCEDVSCLGESDSPVVLEVADFTPTHRRDLAATGFAPRGGLSVRTPVPGRLVELELAYDTARPKAPPSTAQDRHAWSQRPESPAPGQQALVPLTYRPVGEAPPQLPWVAGQARLLTAPTASSGRVQWAVALHRAIVAHLGEGAPPLVTGRYSKGRLQPANRIAVHLLMAADLADAETLTPELAPWGAMVVLVPPDADPSDLVALERAFSAVKRVYQGGHAVTLGDSVDLDLRRFWAEPASGKVRLWSPIPALVAEPRRPRGEGAWGLSEAALLSIAHVFRERFSTAGIGGRGEARYRALVNAVRACGVAAYDMRQVPDSRTERYVHRVHDDLLVTPFSGLLDLRPVLDATALCALGQSRHLGGGLLLPVDLPHAVAAARLGVTP